MQADGIAKHETRNAKQGGGMAHGECLLLWRGYDEAWKLDRVWNMARISSKWVTPNRKHDADDQVTSIAGNATSCDNAGNGIGENDGVLRGEIEYRSIPLATHRGKWSIALLFLTALIFSVQFPWCWYWYFGIMEWKSLKKVDVVNDSLLYLLSLSFTFLAIAFGLIGILSRHERFGLPAKAFYLAVILLSSGLLLLIAEDWISNVIRNPGGQWGLW